MPSSSSPSRNRFLALVLIGATFVTGLVAGIAGDRVMLLHQHRLLPLHGLHFVSAHVVRRLDRELDLTQEQKRKITAILEARTGRIERAWTDVRPAIRAEIEGADRDIAAVLTPAQRPRFETLRAHWRAEASRFFQ